MRVKPNIYRARLGTVLIALTVLAAFNGACLPTTPPESESNRPPVISSLTAKYPVLYPRGNSEIRCDVTDPDGDEVRLKWSCTGGRLIGAGTIVTWEAPNSYGEYPIMVIAEDSKGGSTQNTLMFNVIAKPKEKCCGR